MESVELEVLKLLEENARMSEEEIAEVLALPVDRVKEIIKKFEDVGVILKYKAIVDWEKLQEDFVYALINVKVSLTREKGYDDIAKRIAKFSEVHAVRLVSGEYDFQVVVKGKSLKDIAFFVAEKISTIPEVRDTFTHFVLRTYKEEGVNLFEDEEDRRLAFVP
ncbi:Lrp/AsnC family transcriptional regulator [Archaeoglobus fulgidus]|uniref:Transcriptional regulator n=1 Tax=Archaeoglobus fulgidus DSM 8774 TaxID=1344584 RepID=A0A075WF66_ARCFL|nr:Lrp/AsnC family transcriptional regulator [Archaeoglobus fulgidus]AIG98626.1 Transcriptional regulator [Archaeoglobus fulgidus DSM 8774]